MASTVPSLSRSDLRVKKWLIQRGQKKRRQNHNEAGNEGLATHPSEGVQKKSKSSGDTHLMRWRR
jgi:hypothetical protein